MADSKEKLQAAIKEVMANTPSTVKRAKVKGKKKRAMLLAIAYSKARASGADLPKK